VPRFSPSDVSVVIPTYNAEKSIATLLESIVEQDQKPGEIIVIDDCSTDKTTSIVRGFPVRLLIQEKNGGPAKARNRGVKEAIGKVIMFLDADTLLCNGSFRAMLVGFERKEDIHGQNGVCHESPLNRGWSVSYKAAVERSWADDIGDWDDRSRCINARVGAFTRESLMERGGFDEQYPFASVEDHEFGMRYTQKHKIYTNKHLIVRHHFPGFLKTLKNYWQRTYEIAQLTEKYKGVIASGGLSYGSAAQYIWAVLLLSFGLIAFFASWAAVLLPIFLVGFIFSSRNLVKRLFKKGILFGLFGISLHAFYGVVMILAVIYYFLQRGLTPLRRKKC
jgi:glycosyltransferase involved in cell wall biosynthesis